MGSRRVPNPDAARGTIAGMKIAVMGAGAVGAYFGGMLARAGVDVVLVGREPHVEAIRRRGLRVQTAAFDEVVRVAADTEPRAIAGADVILFCVKSTDTERAAAAIAQHLAPGAVVLSMQNGADNADRLRATLPGVEIAAAAVYVATEMAGPGDVRHHGHGSLDIEPSSRAEEIRSAFERAGVRVRIEPNVRGALWFKLVTNCAWNALSALNQSTYGELARFPGVESVMADIVAECRAVAAADGVAIDGDLAEGVRRIAATMPGQRSSTAQDLARGRASEIDHLNGYVVRRGAVLGVPTPVNRLLQVLVKLAEARATTLRTSERMQ